MGTAWSMWYSSRPFCAGDHQLPPVPLLCSLCGVASQFDSTMGLPLPRRYVKSHSRALAPVLKAFRNADTGNKGWLCHEEFRAFCTSINPAISGFDVQILLDAMDPRSLGKVSFSSCAAILANELDRLAETPQNPPRHASSPRSGPGSSRGARGAAARDHDPIAGWAPGAA